jgi:hypothetical protein
MPPPDPTDRLNVCMPERQFSRHNLERTVG